MLVNRLERSAAGTDGRTTDWKPPVPSWPRELSPHVKLRTYSCKCTHCPQQGSSAGPEPEPVCRIGASKHRPNGRGAAAWAPTNAVAPRDAAGDFYDLARPVQSDPFRFSSVVRSGLGSGLAAGVYRGADALREPTAASGRTRARRNHASARMRSAQYRLQATTTCACACACERARVCAHANKRQEPQATPQRKRIGTFDQNARGCGIHGSHGAPACVQAATITLHVTAAHARHAEAMMRAWQHAYS